MNTTLAELSQIHRGKLSDKWSSYLSTYDRLLAEFKSSPVRLLEIGIQNGGSLELWARYFACAQNLVGCDIDPACADLSFEDPRIKLFIGDANAEATQSAILEHCNQFDVIIDDGSHTSGDIITSFVRYFGHLQYGGMFIIEDLHCSYWKEFDGGLYMPHSSMAFLKQLADVINHEHWGVPMSCRVFLQSFAEHFGLNFDDSLLTQIHSIEFTNSVCVIRKSGELTNLLGNRSVVGVEAKVCDLLIGLNGVISSSPSQTENEWSTSRTQLDENCNADIVGITEIKLFTYSGTGSSQENVISFPIYGNRSLNEFVFDLSHMQNLISLRLDPFVDSVVVEIESMLLSNSESEFDIINHVQTNARIVDGIRYFFDCGDPKIFFEGIGPTQLEGARTFRCKLRYLDKGRSAVHSTLHQFAAQQELRNNDHPDCDATLQARIEALHAVQPALEKALELMRVDYNAALLLYAEREASQSKNTDDLMASSRNECLQALDALRDEFSRSLDKLGAQHALASENARQEAEVRHAVQTQSHSAALTVIAAEREAAQKASCLALEAVREAHIAAIADAEKHAHTMSMAVQEAVAQERKIHDASVAATVAQLSSDHARALEASSSQHLQTLQSHAAELERARAKADEIAVRSDEALQYMRDMFQQAQDVASKQELMQREAYQQSLTSQREEHATAIDAMHHVIAQLSADHQKALDDLYAVQVSTSEAAQQQIEGWRVHMVANLKDLCAKHNTVLDAAAARSEALADAALRDHLVQLAKIDALHANEIDALQRRLVELETMLANVQSWRGYSLLARFQRKPR